LPGNAVGSALERDHVLPSFGQLAR
jgi:hypothetical protein